MNKINPNCKCPNKKCPNHGNCMNCRKYHHKGLHTYCKAGKLEKILRIIHGKINNFGGNKNE
jgi:hypothetical protein